MTNFEIKIILSAKRPLKVLYSEETHDPPEEDIRQHGTCPQIKGHGKAGRDYSGRLWGGAERVLLPVSSGLSQFLAPSRCSVNISSAE